MKIKLSILIFFVICVLVFTTCVSFDGLLNVNTNTGNNNSGNESNANNSNVSSNSRNEPPQNIESPQNTELLRNNEPSQNIEPLRINEPLLPIDSFPLAIRMAEARIERFVFTPERVLSDQRERFAGTWDTIDLVNSKELNNGQLELTFHYSLAQGTRIHTTDWTVVVDGPKNVTVSAFGMLGDENEDISAYDAQRLIDQCKEWYITDPDYRRIVDIIESDVIARLNYDWESYLSGRSRSYQDSLRIGLGVCDVYARLTRDVLTNAGYIVEIWSSPRRHSWNHVILPNGRTLYIDATWYGNEYENHPTDPCLDSYGPWYITYDKNLFERGLKGTIRMHGAWLDAIRVE